MKLPFSAIDTKMEANKKDIILTKLFKHIENEVKESFLDDTLVVNYQEPQSLREKINFSVQRSGTSDEEFIELMNSYMNYSVKTNHKQFFNQLFSGFNFPAFIGEVITTLTNTSMYTYEVAPVATLIEQEMVKLMNYYTGYENGDGIFLSGGSNANLIAMFSARNHALSEIKNNGVNASNKQLVAFVNEQAHYSFEVAGNLLGIGVKNIKKIQADNYGRMIPEKLEEAINLSLSNNEHPFFVAATCGTTILGAYDPLNELAAICKKHQIWLHADGSFGGSIILSNQHKYLIEGIEKTDSFTWNPHKLMNIPLICSALLVNKKGVLEENITDMDTNYIFHNESDIQDLGKKSVQCGRRVDAVKLWFAWKYFGLEGYENQINQLIDLATYAENYVNIHPNLELMFTRQSFTVCFRYTSNKITNSNNFNLLLREQLRKKGLSAVNYATINNQLFIRWVITNPSLEYKDIDVFFNNFLKEANELEKQY
ncbi:MAG: pyridoxal-dependent decarboxylase [Vicingaceae bacterium]|nr:pyridoxal-dependent decarboxylase [Vicingaceae bacterium]